MAAIILGILAGYGAVHLVFNISAVHSSFLNSRAAGGDYKLLPTIVNAVFWVLFYSVILTLRGAQQGGWMLPAPEED